VAQFILRVIFNYFFITTFVFFFAPIHLCTIFIFANDEIEAYIFMTYAGSLVRERYFILYYYFRSAHKSEYATTISLRRAIVIADINVSK